LGVIATAEEKLDEAEQLYRESLQMSANHKDRVVILTFNLAVVLEKRADFSSSQQYFAESVEVAQQIGDTLGMAYGIGGIARTRLHFRSGDSHKTATWHELDTETSLILSAATSAILKQHGLTFNQDERDKLDALTRTLREHFADRADALWQHGLGLSLEEAVKLALSSHSHEALSADAAIDHTQQIGG
jgi:tetratricopeptide (TPR) repeat protein